MDLALDTDGDLLVSDDLDLVMVDGDDDVRQRVRLAVLARQGDWYLNVTDGLDWLGEVMVKNPDLTSIDASIRAAIASVPGVVEIVSYVSELSADRRLTVRYAFRTGGAEIEDTLLVE